MAVTQYGDKIYGLINYRGLSTDPKPTDSKVVNEAKFTELGGKVWKYNSENINPATGNGWWIDNEVTSNSLFYTTIDYETLTIAQTVTGLTSTKYEKAVSAVIEIKSGSIYFSTSGTTPTSSNSFNGFEGDIIELNSLWELKNFKAIATVNSAILQIEYKG